MRSLLVVLLLVGLSGVARGEESAMVLAARADLACVQFETIGVCRRNTPPFVGIKVRYWQPVLLVETLPRSGETGILEFKGLVTSLGGVSVVRAALSAGAQGGCPGDIVAGGGAQADTSSLRMNEAHVFGFPFSDALSAAIEAPCEGPPDFAGTVSYLSEMDAREWRMGEMERHEPMAVMTQRLAPMCDRFGAALPGLCMGNWGSVYPRTGFSVHASEVVASAMAAFRAVDAASFKPQIPRRVIMPVLFWPSVRYDRMQLVSPVTRPCMSIGRDPGLWDYGARSMNGRYVWIYWRKKECCLF